MIYAEKPESFELVYLIIFLQGENILLSKDMKRGKPKKIL